jgi:hypothetical protein
MISVRSSRKWLARHARLLIASAAAVIAVIAISLAVPAPASATARSQAAPLTKSPRATATPPPLTLQDIVQKLGATTYQNAYGGMTVSPTRQETAVPSHITIYVVAAAPDATHFLSAIRNAAATPGGRATSYSIVDVRHSFAQLYALTLKMAQQRDMWLRRGINLQMWGPDASTNKVAVSLKSYTSAAAQSLYASYGTSWMSVGTTSLSLNLHQVSNAPHASVNIPLASTAQGRFQDSSPFFGGDYIDNPNTYAACTDGFVMAGATHPDNRWLMTSGHCGSQSTWYTNLSDFYLLGATATNYFNNYGGSTDYDVQTIGLTGGWKAYGDVWGNDYTVYNPYTTLTPDDTQLITFDGAISGEVHDIKVTTEGPVCIPTNVGTTCGVGEAGSDTGPVICQDGDSGGPVYQRTSTAGEVQAIGLITDSNKAGNVCVYTLLDAIMGPTDTALDTNPAG